jgi:hypothetical protein
VQWVMGEVVGVENAVAIHPLPRLALVALSQFWRGTNVFYVSYIENDRLSMT